MKSLATLVFIIFFLSFNILAQRLNNNQINALPIETNPALTGIFSSGNLNLGYHSFFNESNFNTSFANYQTHLTSINSGIGININHDDQWFDSRTAIGIAYAYHFNLAQSLGLSIGLNATYNRFNTVWHSYPINLVFNKNRVDLNSGVVLHHDRFFVSFSVNQINTLDIPFQINAIYGHKFRIKNIKDLELIPNIRYASVGKFQTVEPALNINYRGLKGIFGLQINDSYVIGLGHHWSRISIQYMLTKFTSLLNSPTNNYHQVSLQLMLPKTINRQTKALDFRLF